MLQNMAVEAVNLELARRLSMASLIVHRAQIPSWVADSDIIKLTILMEFSYEAYLAASQLFCNRETNKSQFLFCLAGDGFMEYPVYSLKKLVLL